jgi:hypothetical protein
MKKVLSLMSVLAVLIAMNGTPLPADEWFDMQNCAICKHMGEHMDMMQHIQWDTHLINTGMMSVAIIPSEYQATMKAAHKNMEATIERLKGGEEMKLCGFCNSYGKLLSQGAKSEDIETPDGSINLLTSTDPKVIAQIHEHANKSIAEHKKMMEHMSHEHAKSGGQ